MSGCEIARVLRAACVSSAPLARAGLGNELLPLAKAHLAAQALGVPLIPPAWGLDRRPYWRYFSRSRLDVAPYHVLLAGRTRIRFTEVDYRATGLIDYGQAALRWWAQARHEQRRVVVVNEGMWGGFAAVDEARPFIRRYLSAARGTAQNVLALSSRRRPRALLVGIHVRAGDFAPPAAEVNQSAEWNRALPLDWYRSVCRALQRRLGDEVQFLVLGGSPDGPAGVLAGELGALTTWSERRTDVSDLVLLSAADLLVCSVSAFSLAAVWLSDAPYLWPRDQLHDEDGWLSIWGAEEGQKTGLTASNRLELSAAREPPIARGIPVGGDGFLSEPVTRALIGSRGPWDRRADLIYYGVVRGSQAS